MAPGLVSRAAPASARNSRCLENQAVISEPRIPSRISRGQINSIVGGGAMPRPSSRSPRGSRKSTARERNITKALITPCSRVMVTMSPLATWLISWASTASSSAGGIPLRMPVDTATRARLGEGPVAKAFHSGEP